MFMHCTIFHILHHYTDAIDRFRCPMELPPIYIPSKGRWMKSKSTWINLISEDLSFTLVVEPKELEKYRDAVSFCMKTSQSKSQPQIVTLPEDDMGIGYARNHILNVLSPNSWFWMVDDDISSFFAFSRGKEKMDNVSIRTALGIANPQDVLALEPAVCIIGLEYSHFMFDAARLKTFYTLNSYANICVCINRSLFPQHSKYDIKYRFPVREDYDLCMQVIASGGMTFRCRCAGFRAPSMGSAEGGMTPFYNTQHNLIKQCNDLMVSLWGDIICKEVIRGSGKSQRLDVKINWKKLTLLSEKSKASGLTLLSQLGQPCAEDVISMWSTSRPTKTT